MDAQAVSKHTVLGLGIKVVNGLDLSPPLTEHIIWQKAPKSDWAITVQVHKYSERTLILVLKKPMMDAPKTGEASVSDS